ncbi:MAG: MetS family NSS transporter small subunit [Firmicutes bacterium]|nr:MetS family NSS transporter small subunit [Bacillota bacterium]
MTGSAIAMMLLGVVMLWGGAAYCISVAMKNRD